MSISATRNSDLGKMAGRVGAQFGPQLFKASTRQRGFVNVHSCFVLPVVSTKVSNVESYNTSDSVVVLTIHAYFEPHLIAVVQASCFSTIGLRLSII